MIPLSLTEKLDKLAALSVHPVSRELPPHKQTWGRRHVPRGAWRVAPLPEEEQRDDQHLFRLTVLKNKTWKIDLTDLTTGKVINWCSGTNGAIDMDGEVKTGKEFYETRKIT